MNLLIEGWGLREKLMAQKEEVLFVGEEEVMIDEQ